MKWLRVPALALAGALLIASAAAESPAKCKTLTQCYPGSKSNAPCSVKDGSCANSPCVDFTGGTCFAKDQAGKCQFTWVDCGEFFAAATSGSTGSGTGGSSHVTLAPNTTQPPTPTPKKTADPDASNGSGSTKFVFIIIGGAFAVIAVAIIFLVLIRRSRTPEDDDDELVVTPAMIKAPETFQQQPQYAPYAPAHPAANPTTPTNRVVQYYKDNALPSPRVSSKGFGVAPPPTATAKVVRAAPSANAPTFFGSSSNASTEASVYTAAPMAVGNETSFRSTQPMAMNELGYAPATNAVHVGAAAAPAYGMTEERHTGVMVQMHAEQVELPAMEAEGQAAPGQDLSPDGSHRDSFEF